MLGVFKVISVILALAGYLLATYLTSRDSNWMPLIYVMIVLSSITFVACFGGGWGRAAQSWGLLVLVTVLGALVLTPRSDAEPLFSQVNAILLSVYFLAPITVATLIVFGVARLIGRGI